MKLYNLHLSGNCYKVRLFASLAHIELELIDVDFAAGAHRQPPLVDLNPWAELPILVDGKRVLRDSQAILVYLAGTQGGHAWWPEEAYLQAQVMQWLSTAANEIQHGPCAARLVDLFGYPLDKPQALTRAARILSLLDAHLAEQPWLALGRPTIAECAVFPYVALAPDGGIDLAAYPNVSRWIEQVKSLPGYLALPGA